MSCSGNSKQISLKHLANSSHRRRPMMSSFLPPAKNTHYSRHLHLATLSNYFKPTAKEVTVIHTSSTDQAGTGVHCLTCRDTCPRPWGNLSMPSGEVYEPQSLSQQNHILSVSIHTTIITCTSTVRCIGTHPVV